MATVIKLKKSETAGSGTDPSFGHVDGGTF